MILLAIAVLQQSDASLQSYVRDVRIGGTPVEAIYPFASISPGS